MQALKYPLADAVTQNVHKSDTKSASNSFRPIIKDELMNDKIKMAAISSVWDCTRKRSKMPIDSQTPKTYMPGFKAFN